MQTKMIDPYAKLLEPYHPLIKQITDIYHPLIKQITDIYHPLIKQITDIYHPIAKKLKIWQELTEQAMNPMRGIGEAFQQMMNPLNQLAEVVTATKLHTWIKHTESAIQRLQAVVPVLIKRRYMQAIYERRRPSLKGQTIYEFAVHQGTREYQKDIWNKAMKGELSYQTALEIIIYLESNLIDRQQRKAKIIADGTDAFGAAEEELFRKIDSWTSNPKNIPAMYAVIRNQGVSQAIKGLTQLFKKCLIDQMKKRHFTKSLDIEIENEEGETTAPIELLLSNHLPPEAYAKLEYTLSPIASDPIILYKLENPDASFASIAETFGVPRSTIQSRIEKARKTVGWRLWCFSHVSLVIEHSKAEKERY